MKPEHGHECAYLKTKEQVAVRKSEFYVKGQVQKTGKYQWLPGMDVIRGLVMAGGITFESGGPSVSVWRDQKFHHLNVQDIMNGKSADFRILPGDVIIVPYQGCFGGMSEEQIAAMNESMKKHASSIE